MGRVLALQHGQLAAGNQHLALLRREALCVHPQHSRLRRFQIQGRNAHLVVAAQTASRNKFSRSAAHPDYSTASASNFASLDALELERLHAQLRTAYSWLDISTSLEDFGGMMVDEQSVVAAIVRLSHIYQHLGAEEQAEVRAAGLVERLAAMAERRLPSLSPQQLAATLDALARLEFQPSASFLKAAKKQANGRITDFTPAQLPLLLCAFVALGQDPGATVVNALGDALTQNDLAVAPADVARMLVALAGLSTKPPTQVLRGLASVLRRQLDSFRPTELSQVLAAFAKLKFHPGKDVVKRIAARAGLRGVARAAK